MVCSFTENYSSTEKKNTEWFIYTKIFQICVHFKKRCRFVFCSARAFIRGITWSYTTSNSFLYLCGSCLARIIGKTRPRLFWWPRPRSDYAIRRHNIKHNQPSSLKEKYLAGMSMGIRPILCVKTSSWMTLVLWYLWTRSMAIVGTWTNKIYETLRKKKKILYFNPQ